MSPNGDSRSIAGVDTDYDSTATDAPVYAPEFGISELPFRLSPDPRFNFESRGHRAALTTLRRALAEETGFVVVSGDIGAGKTTLVRTLLAELDRELVAVSHIVSAQLDEHELLSAALIGFGLSGTINSAASETQASVLLRFLIKLDKQARRGVLVIDEAQHLSPEALEPLLQLIARRSPRSLPLQVWLVGQPELQTLIDRPAGQPLRDLIAASCKLGPLDCEETAAYVEHRLRRVGWSGTPQFEAGALDQVFRQTDGIPRRINLLCHRLLLSCTLEGKTTIGLDDVAEVAATLCTEAGGSTALRVLPSVAPGHRPLLPPPSANTEPPLQQIPRGRVLCLAAGCGDHVKAAALMEALCSRSGADAAILVRVYDNEGLEMSRPLFKSVDIDRCIVNLHMACRPDKNIDAIANAFDAVVDVAEPSEVIVFDGSAEALACSTVAKARGIFVVHVGAGLRTTAGPTADLIRVQTDRLADLLYTTQAEASRTLVDEGLPPERIHFVGSLLVDALHASTPLPAPSRGADEVGDPGDATEPRPDYAFVVLSESVNVEDRLVFQDLAAILRDVSRDIVLVWAMQRRVQTAWQRFRLERLVSPERVVVIPSQPHPDYAAWLRDATCVLTDSWNVQEEATALGVPCLTLGRHPACGTTADFGSNATVGLGHALATHAVWNCLFNGPKNGRPPALWDGKTGSRIAGYLAAHSERGRSATAPGV